MCWRNSYEQLHRENDLPAVEAKSGSKMWYINGYLHRERGPAVISHDKQEYWFLNDNEYETPEEMPLNLFISYCKWVYKKEFYCSSV